MDYIWILLVVYLSKALALTLVLESPIVWIGLGAKLKRDDKPKLICNFFLINAITNITLNLCIFFFSFVLWGVKSLAIIIVIAELIIPFIEAKMYCYGTNQFTMRRALITCYIANLVSFLLGGWIVSIWG